MTKATARSARQKLLDIAPWVIDSAVRVAAGLQPANPDPLNAAGQTMGQGPYNERILSDLLKACSIQLKISEDLMSTPWLMSENPLDGAKLVMMAMLNGKLSQAEAKPLIDSYELLCNMEERQTFLEFIKKHDQ